MNPIVLSLIRHAVTALGGFLVARGYMDPAGVSELAGAVVVLAGAAAGVVEKRTRRDAPPPA